MTRPRKATVDYFPHACTHGKTMFILEDQWGNDGYAFWFKLLELLGTSEGHVYDAGNPAAWRYLVAKTRVNSETAGDILQCLAEMGAIDAELWSEKVIWSDNFVKGIRDAYRKRTEDIPIRPDIRRRKPASEGITSCSYPQSKLKESKVNNIYIPPQPPASSSHKKSKPLKSSLPEKFEISDEVKSWAEKKGHDNLEKHLEAFIELCQSNGYTAADWDSKFKRAIREDWGKVKDNGSRAGPGPSHNDIERARQWALERKKSGISNPV